MYIETVCNSWDTKLLTLSKICKILKLLVYSGTSIYFLLTSMLNNPF